MTKSTHKVMVAECPGCETSMRFHKPLKLGQIVVCPECYKQLEVYNLNPLELDWAFDDYEGDYEEQD